MKFNIRKLLAPKEVCRPDYYLTVDFPEDLQLVRKIFKILLEKGKGNYFLFSEVIDLIDRKPYL